MANIKFKGNRVTIKPSLELEKQKYLKLIQEAQLLGDMEEVAKLQDEWKIRKIELSNN